METISLKKFQSILFESFAVCVNDTLYFVGYDDQDNPYVADNDNQDKIELDEVDGEIEVSDSGFFFYVSGSPIELKILHWVNPLNLI